MRTHRQLVEIRATAPDFGLRVADFVPGEWAATETSETALAPEPQGGPAEDIRYTILQAEEVSKALRGVSFRFVRGRCDWTPL